MFHSAASCNVLDASSSSLCILHIACLLTPSDLNRRSRLQLLLNQQQVRTAANLPSGAPLNGFLLEQLQRQPARATNSFASAQQPAFSAAGMSHEAIERLFGSLLPAPAQPPAANNQLRELIAMSELLRNQPLPNQPQQVPQQQQNNSLTAAAAAAALSGRAGRLERDLSMSSARVAADLYTAPAAAASSPSNRETGAQQMGSITVCKTVALYTSLDDIRLTPYQCLARKQIEYFEASPKECEGAQGRNRAIVVKQVGIRCRHCPNLPKQQRGAAPGFFPGKLDGIYQAAQNIAK